MLPIATKLTGTRPKVAMVRLKAVEFFLRYLQKTFSVITSVLTWNRTLPTEMLRPRWELHGNNSAQAALKLECR